MRDWHRFWLGLLCIGGLLILEAGCGGGGGSTTGLTPSSVLISVSPGSATVTVGKTQQFTAAVSGSSNTAVTWSVGGITGGNATLGTITSSGLYTAPAAVPNPATVTVTATSQADSAKSASATVTITATAPTASLTASSTTITAGQTLTLVVATSGATSCTASAAPADSAWTGNVTCNGSVTITPTVTGTETYSITATGAGGSTTASAQPVTIQKAQPLSVTVSPATATVDTDGTVALSATIAGGTGNATVAWTLSPANGSLSPTSGLTTTYTAPATLPSPNTVTVTATATDGGQTATTTATVTINEQITISIDLPNNEMTFDYPSQITVNMTCTGCELNDTVNVQFLNVSGSPTFTQAMQNPKALSEWLETFNFTGTVVPTVVKVWVNRSDGILSNTLLFTVNFSQNGGIQDPSSGKSYYVYSGDGNVQPQTFIYASDGTAGGSFLFRGNAITIDGHMLHETQPAVLQSGINGISTYDLSTGILDLIKLTNGEPLAVSAAGGLVCATIPTGGTSPNTTDAVDCASNGTTFTLPGVPAGSQPAAVKVIGSVVYFYGRGDQTLRWDTVVSGTSAKVTGSLQLSQFVVTDANFWSTYPGTTGWDLIQIGTSTSNPTLGVMGQVKNADGTISQKLAVITGTSGTPTVTYFDLPPGTTHIAPDPLDSTVVVAEYEDFSGGSAPITRFEKVDVNTANSSTLSSTSTLDPGTGFLITTDDKYVAVFGEGKADFEPYQ